MLEQKGDRIYLSRKGIHVSNGVMADFPAVEKLCRFFHLDERMFWQYTDKKSQKFYSRIREVDSAVEKNTGVFFS